MPIILALFVLFQAAIVSAQECGPEIPCEIEGGSYHLRIPEGEGPHPVLVWFHGHSGNGRSIHSQSGLSAVFSADGWVLVAPNGRRTEAGARTFPGVDGSARDDVAFVRAILEDVRERVSMDDAQVFAAGFSAGGSMVWLFACEAGTQLAGMVAVSGALRRPNSTECAGLEGLPIMHIHGFTDKTVPFEGRIISDWHQGSIWDAMSKARTANGCRSNPDQIWIEDTYRTRVWDRSCLKAPIQLEINDGGHGLPSGWVQRALAFFKRANRQ